MPRLIASLVSFALVAVEPAGAVAAAGALPTAIAAAALSPAALVHRQGEGGDPLDLGVDLTIAAGAGAVGDDGLPVGVDEEVQQLLADDHVLPQRHRPRLGDDDRGLAPHLLEPGPELLGVRDRRREGDQLDGAVQVDDDLLPHGAAQAVGEVVHLVHHHEPQPQQGAGAGVDHVAQHLGRHDNDGRLGVDGGVPSEQPHRVHAVASDEVVVLLVGQGLDGGGVETLETGFQGQEGRVLPHDRLAGTSGSCDEHAGSLIEVVAALQLVVVQLEGVGGRETAQRGGVHGSTISTSHPARGIATAPRRG